MDFFKTYFLDYIKENNLLLIIIIINIFGFTFLIFNNNQKIVYEKSDNNTTLEVSENTLSMETNIPNKIYVDIKGAIKNPGVYEINEGSLVNDAIILAGGVKSGGTTSLINLSKKLKDGMVIYVATTTEVNKLKKENVLKTLEDEKISENVTTSNDVKVTKEESLGYVDSTETKIEEDKTTLNTTNNTNDSNIKENNNTKVNLNTATINDLTSISGIGESKAKSIIEYRENNGSFKSIEDILNVSGIGQSLYEKIKDYIEV